MPIYFSFALTRRTTPSPQNIIVANRENGGNSRGRFHLIRWTMVNSYLYSFGIDLCPLDSLESPTRTAICRLKVNLWPILLHYRISHNSGVPSRPTMCSLGVAVGGGGGYRKPRQTRQYRCSIYSSPASRHRPSSTNYKPFRPSIRPSFGYVDSRQPDQTGAPYMTPGMGYLSDSFTSMIVIINFYHTCWNTGRPPLSKNYHIHWLVAPSHFPLLPTSPSPHPPYTALQELRAAHLSYIVGQPASMNKSCRRIWLSGHQTQSSSVLGWSIFPFSSPCGYYKGKARPPPDTLMI